MHEDAKQQNLDLEVWKSEDASSTLSCISIICIHYSSMRTATKAWDGQRLATARIAMPSLNMLNTTEALNHIYII